MPREVTGVDHVFRLKKRADFLKVSKDGFRSSRPNLILLAKRQEKRGVIPEYSCRVGYTTSKKVGNAVERNRCRRRLRAAVRELMPRFGIDNYDYVIIGKTSTVTTRYSWITKDLRDALLGIAKERSRSLAPLSRKRFNFR
jgi:ribonuclease P protein component